MTEKGKEGRTETGVPFTSNETVSPAGKDSSRERSLSHCTNANSVLRSRIFRLTVELFECSELYIFVCLDYLWFIDTFVNKIVIVVFFTYCDNFKQSSQRKVNSSLRSVITETS